tara:strand:+ start:224 stop:802 length:579 start_codon:yes stop_codon:yes gene_type:complete
MEHELIETVSPEIKCSICLGNDIEDDNLCFTNCSHKFCKPCLDEWFNLGKISCPECRNIIHYFNHQNKEYRVIKVNDQNYRNSNHQQQDAILANMVGRMKFYKYFFFTAILINIYSLLLVEDSENKVELCNDSYESCMENLTQIKDFNSELLSDINSEHDTNEILTQISIIRHGAIYGCLMPISYINKCFGN